MVHSDNPAQSCISAKCYKRCACRLRRGLDAHRDWYPAKPVVQVDRLSAENAQSVLGKVEQVDLLSFDDPIRKIHSGATPQAVVMPNSAFMRQS